MSVTPFRYSRWVFLSLILAVLGLEAQPLREPIPLDPEVRQGELENGLRYYIRKNTQPEKRVEMRLVVKAGSLQEDDHQLGLAHFVEHMAFNGTQHFQKNELIDYLQSVGVKFGAHLNAYTSFEETVYMLTLPTDKPEVISKGFQVLEDWAHGVTFSEEEIDKERGVVLEEWRTGLGANERIRQKTWPLMLKGSRYKDRLPIGDPDIIRAAEYESIRQFYRDWYRPNLMGVVVVGDIDTDAIEASLKTHFNRIKSPANMRPRLTYEVPSHVATRIAIATDPEQPFANVQIIYKHLREKDLSYAGIRKKLKYRLYSMMFNERLRELTQAENPPFIFANADYGKFLGNMDGYFASVGVPETGIYTGLRAILLENKRVSEHGFTDSELDRARQQLSNQYERIYKERNNLESSSIAGELVQHYLEEKPVPGIETEYQFAIEEMPRISLGEMNQLAQQWITDENRIIKIVAPEKEDVKLPREPEIVALLDSLSELRVVPYIDSFVAEPLLAQRPLSGAIYSTKEIREIGATELTLTNGVKVVLKPTVFKEEEILLSAYSQGGHSLVAESEVISAIHATRIVQESGLRTFSAVDLQKLLAGKTLRVSPYITDVSEGITGSAAPKDFETMLQLVYLYFTDVRENETAFNAYLAKQKGFVQNLMSMPEFYFSDQIARIMTQNHPRAAGFSTPEELEQIDQEKAFEIYRERFADADDFVFFLVGNFRIAEIKPLLATYLGNLPVQRGEETFKDWGIRPPTGMIEEEFRRGTEPKSQVNIMYSGTWQNQKDRYLLNILSQILNIKLLESLREEQGGVYGVGASANTTQYPYHGYTFSVRFPCAPENVSKLVEIAYHEIDQLRTYGPDPMDLQKVQEQELRQLEKSLKENRYWLAAMQRLYYEQKDAGQLTAPYLSQRIHNLEPDEIRRVALTYLNENRVSCVLFPSNMEETSTVVPTPSSQSESTLVVNESSTPEQVVEPKEPESTVAMDSTSEDIIEEETVLPVTTPLEETAVVESPAIRSNPEETEETVAVDEVLGKYLNAIGGEARLNRVEVLRTEATVQVMGMDISTTTVKTTAGRMMILQQTPIGENRIIYNGTEFLVNGPQGNQALSEEKIRNMQYQKILFFEKDFRELGINATLEGIEAVGETPAYKVVFTTSDGEVTTKWFHTVTGLLVKSKDQNQVFEIEAYEEINGIKFPKVLTVKMGGMEGTMEYGTIEVNPAIDKNWFSLP